MSKHVHFNSSILVVRIILHNLNCFRSLARSSSYVIVVESLLSFHLPLFLLHSFLLHAIIGINYFAVNLPIDIQIKNCCVAHADKDKQFVCLFSTDKLLFEINNSFDKQSICHRKVKYTSFRIQVQIFDGTRSGGITLYQDRGFCLSIIGWGVSHLNKKKYISIVIARCWAVKKMVIALQCKWHISHVQNITATWQWNVLKVKKKSRLDRLLCLWALTGRWNILIERGSERVSERERQKPTNRICYTNTFY